MTVDCHQHLWDAYAESGEVNRRKVETLLRECERAGIDRSVLMPDRVALPFYFNEAQQRQLGEAARRIAEDYPNRFYPLLRVNPLLPVGVLMDVLADHVLNGPVCGVKLTIQMNARDERLDELAAFMERHDIPVLWHAWYKTTDKNVFESDPSDIAFFARRHPKLRVLMAHMTAARLRGILDVRDCANVAVDTSGSFPEDGYLAYGLRHLGARRILFGSDYPIRDIPVKLAQIDSVDMAEAHRAMILSGNAQAFFGGRKETT
jgi:uncharacterized protein